jgi:hypothetical protein
MNTQEAAALVKEKTNDELLAILADSTNWQPDILDAARAELQRRGVEYNGDILKHRQETPAADDKPQVVSQTLSRVFAYGTCALALALILFLPPVLIELKDIPIHDDGSFGAPTSEEHFIWFVPIFARGSIITSLWIAELVAWLILSVAILFIPKHKTFHTRPAMAIFTAILVMSAVIPVKRIAYFANGSTGERHIVAQMAHSNSDQSFAESLRIIWSNVPIDREEPVNQYIYNTIQSGEIAPAVMAMWILGIFLAGFTGFFFKSNRPLVETRRQSG